MKGKETMNIDDREREREGRVVERVQHAREPGTGS